MNPIIPLPAPVVEACRKLHANEEAFQAFLSEGQINIEARRWELVEAIVLDASDANKAALASFLQALPSRQSISADVVAGRLNPRRIHGRALAEVLEEPLRKEISKLEDQLRQSLQNDADAAEEFGTESLESAKTRGLSERIAIATRYWNTVRNHEGCAATVISRLGFAIGHLPATADQSLKAYRDSQAATSHHLRQLLAVDQAPTPSEAMRKELTTV
jgi:hypothetical protein